MKYEAQTITTYLIVSFCVGVFALCIGFIIGARHYIYSPFYKPVYEASASIHPTAGNTVSGSVTFVHSDKGGVLITADVTGLTPGEHGFHIHDLGDCTCGDAECAGGHFNPTHQPHGGPDDNKRHAGDLGNITADAHGNAHYSMHDASMMLNGSLSIIGRAVIIHAGADDFVSQPSGNAGKRVACGVIGIKKIKS